MLHFYKLDDVVSGMNKLSFFIAKFLSSNGNGTRYSQRKTLKCKLNYIICNSMVLIVFLFCTHLIIMYRTIDVSDFYAHGIKRFGEHIVLSLSVCG